MPRARRALTALKAEAARASIYMCVHVYMWAARIGRRFERMHVKLPPASSLESVARRKRARGAGLIGERPMTTFVDVSRALARQRDRQRVIDWCMHALLFLWGKVKVRGQNRSHLLCWKKISEIIAIIRRGYVDECCDTWRGGRKAYIWGHDGWFSFLFFSTTSRSSSIFIQQNGVVQVIGCMLCKLHQKSLDVSKW